MVNTTLREGDIIIVGTDGLFDNLFAEQILMLSNENPGSAEYIGNVAVSASFRKDIETPYSSKAKENGIFYQGGKMDDISLLVVSILPL